MSPRFTSQPPSPSHGDKSILNDITTVTSSPVKFASLPSYPGKQKHKNNVVGTKENLNGSSLSLASNGSSVYSTQEEKTNSDILKLELELVEEQRKVFSLTNQLTTNAHVVSAFEQSLANMTARLTQITATAEQKDAELAQLRRTMAALRQSGVDAGLIQDRGHNELMRQKSTDSVTSISSAHSNTSLNSGDEKERSKASSGGPKRSGWLRNSFSKAFSRSKVKNKGGSLSDCDDGSIVRLSDDRIDAHESEIEEDIEERRLSASASSNDLRSKVNVEGELRPEMVTELRRQLLEKDSLLTETRLEALSSAHQLESLKDTVSKMKNELLNLRQDNEKLSTHVTTKSLGSSESSLNTSHETEIDRRLSLALSEASVLSGPSTLDMSGTTDPSNQDSKLVSVLVELSESPARESIKIGTVAASGKLSWELLDSLVERIFKEFVMRVDPVTNLGLGSSLLTWT